MDRSGYCLIVTSPSPGYLARTAFYPPGATFGPRRLDDFELVWLLSGSGRWTFRAHDGAVAVTHDLRPGSVWLARAGGVDEYAWGERTPSTHGYMHFTWPGAPDPAVQDAWPLVRHPGPGVPLAALCDYLLYLAQEENDLAHARSAQVLGLIVEIFTAGPLATVERIRSEPVRAALAYARAEWHAGGMRLLSLQELARAAGVSTGHVARESRRELGMGLIEALELVRLGRAAIELQRGDRPLDAVARAAGFVDPYHFSRRFSRVYGSPPIRYRRTRRDDPLAPLAQHGLLPVWHELGAGG